MKSKAVFVLAALLLLSFSMTACSEETDEVTSYFSPGEYIVTNILDSYRLLKAAPVLVINGHNLDADADFAAVLNGMTPAMRDAINIVLRAKTEEQLKEPGILDQLRAEIVQVLHDKLNMNYVTYVYFNDFVVQ